MRFLSSGSRPVRLTVVGAALALACLSLVAQTRNAAQTAKPAAAGAAGRPIKVLFLGQDEDRPHNPARMFPLLAAPLARRGIQLTYVSTPADALAAAKLGYYDAVMLFGNHEAITPQQEKALLDYVEGGRGLIALHSASAEFPASDKYVSLVGGQFQRHGTGEFTAEIVQPSHPITQGMKPFMTWDETYVHTKHNTVDRTVLMERVDAQGREPWTWVRTQGKGRVFYTAYGHDERTWSKPEFQTLVERAVAWAVDDAARRSWQQLEIPPVTYVDGFNVPNYEQRDPAPKYQLPFTPPDAAKFIQAPGEFEVKLFASEPDIIKPITMAFDERGRLWVIEAMDYPNEVLNGNPGDDRIKILEDTNGDGRADKFTIFAENLNVPIEPHVRQRRRHRRRAAALPVSQGHERRRQGGLARGAEHRLGHPRHARRAVEPAVRARQSRLGRRRLFGIRRHDERQADAVHAGPVPLQAGRQRVRIPDDVDQQHVGAGLLGDVRRVRLDRQQRSELVPGDPQPVFRRHRGAAGRRPRRRRAGLSERRRVLRRAPDDAVHPAGRRVRRLHGRGRSLLVHGAARSRRNTGTASRSSPSRPRTWSDRRSSRKTGPASSPATDGTCCRAPRNGSPRSPR